MTDCTDLTPWATLGVSVILGIDIAAYLLCCWLDKVVPDLPQDDDKEDPVR